MKELYKEAKLKKTAEIGTEEVYARKQGLKYRRLHTFLPREDE